MEVIPPNSSGQDAQEHSHMAKLLKVSDASSTNLLHRAPVPPRISPAIARPWLYSAILGNGHLLVCLDETASPVQIFYPHVDAGPHVHSFLIGIQLLPAEETELADETGTREQNVEWLADPAWTHQLNYEEGTATLHAVSTHPRLPVRVDQDMCVHYHQDLMINEISMTNLGDTPFSGKLVVYAGFDFEHRSSGNTCYFDIPNAMLAFFANNRYAAIFCSRPVENFDCDQSTLDQTDNLFRHISQGRFEERAFAVGQVRGSARYDLGLLTPGETTLCSMHIGFATSLKSLQAFAPLLSQSQFHAEATRRWWQEAYATAVPELSVKAISTLYSRSLITLKLLTDSETGGIIAAPECDPDFRSCGGYGFCWPRDGAFIASTLDTVRQYEHARAFYNWALSIQEESGGWYQRYYVHRALAPTWGFIQFDEIGAIVWSICRHIQLTEDIEYGRQVFAQLTRACEYMQRELDVETGLAPVTKDLWEERDGISTYACACTWAGFNEFARLSLTLGLLEEAEYWSHAASQLKDAIEKHLWDPSRQRFLRGIKTRIDLARLEQLRGQPDFSEENMRSVQEAGKTYYMLLRDATPDASILGLSVPFGVFPANDPRMLATAEAIANTLTSPVGGIYRYQGDNYRGSNPWILCTLWLALQDIYAGQHTRGYQLYNWALEHRTALDLLAEQIDGTTDQPCWIMPLGWSHAMFLLATDAALRYGMLT